MKKYCFMIVLLAAIVFRSSFIFASEGRIYISESSPSKTTLLSELQPDGTALKQIHVDGFMARISPDNKYVAYFKYNEGLEGLLLADANGKKIKEFSLFKDKAQGNAFVPLNLIWSPDGTKTAILMKFKAYPFVLYLSVLDLKTGKLNLVYSRVTRSETATDNAEWLPDSKRILISGGNGIKILDPEAKKLEEIIHNGTMAHLIKNGQEIVYVTGDAQTLQYQGEMGGKPFSVWSYNMGTKGSKKIADLPAPPSMVSQDGRYIVYNRFGANFSPKEASVFYYDVLNKKTVRIGNGNFVLMAEAFSPDNARLICLGVNPNEEENGNYYLLNLETGKLTPFKKSVIANNEAFLLLTGYGLAHVDWR